MSLFEIAAVLFAIAAAIAFLNYRFAKLPSAVAMLAGGLLGATAIVGGGTWCLFAVAGVPVPFGYCLVFGALISPTDPVAVLAIMEELHVPKTLEINVTGESLLNDGIGVVVFTALLGLAAAPGSVSAPAVALLFAREVIGGVLLG